MPCPSHPPWLDHSNYKIDDSVLLNKYKIKNYQFESHGFKFCLHTIIVHSLFTDWETVYEYVIEVKPSGNR
jgi:hypothetical protein